MNNTTILVDRGLLKELLSSAKSTAMHHRNTAEEMYALGALEATANLIYIMICSDDNLDGLDILCQSSAQEALQRMQKISEPYTLPSKRSA